MRRRMTGIRVALALLGLLMPRMTLANDATPGPGNAGTRIPESACTREWFAWSEAHAERYNDLYDEYVADSGVGLGNRLWELELENARELRASDPPPALVGMMIIQSRFWELSASAYKLMSVGQDPPDYNAILDHRSYDYLARALDAVYLLCDPTLNDFGQNLPPSEGTPYPALTATVCSDAWYAAALERRARAERAIAAAQTDGDRIAALNAARTEEWNSDPPAAWVAYSVVLTDGYDTRRLQLEVPVAYPPWTGAETGQFQADLDALVTAYNAICGSAFPTATPVAA